MPPCPRNPPPRGPPCPGFPCPGFPCPGPARRSPSPGEPFCAEAKSDMLKTMQIATVTRVKILDSFMVHSCGMSGFNGKTDEWSVSLYQPSKVCQVSHSIAKVRVFWHSEGIPSPNPPNRGLIYRKRTRAPWCRIGTETAVDGTLIRSDDSR